VPATRGARPFIIISGVFAARNWRRFTCAHEGWRVRQIETLYADIDLIKAHGR
jgi:hypothetical protein